MLGHEFRFRASNTQNQAIIVSLTARFFKRNSSGVLEYSTEQVLINAVSVAATTGATVSGDFDNSASLWEGAELTLWCAAATTTNGHGSVAVTLERSTDLGTTWPTAGQGEFVDAYQVTIADATTQRRRNMKVE